MEEIKMKPKALVVASVASMIEQFNIPNIELLIEQGYEVHVACNFTDGGTIPTKKVLELQKNLKNRGVIFHQVDFDRNVFNIINNYKALLQLKKIFKYNFSLVHSHSPIGGALARICAIKYRKKGLISIYTAHGFHFFKGAPKKNWIIFYPIEKFLSRFTDKLITINQEDYKIAKNKFYAKEVIYIPGIGIDLEKFKPISIAERNKLRGRMGLLQNDFIIIHVGELNTNKNQKMLIEAVNSIKDELPNLKVLLVGDGTLKEKYKTMIENKGLENVIKLLGYRTDINKLMAVSDIAISTSKREGLPVNVLEAMATGLPIIVTNSRGNRDLVINNINGYTVKVNDNEELAKKIHDLYYNDKIRRNFSENNLTVIQSYSLKNIIKEIKTVVYEDIDDYE